MRLELVPVVRGEGRVCEMCMCLARCGGEWIGFGFYQSSMNRGSVGRMFGLRWCG